MALRTEVVGGKNLGEEEILSIAAEIWKKVRESKVDVRDAAASDRLLDRLRKEYPEFHHTFPLVLRTMVGMQKYSRRSFALFIRGYKPHYKTKEDFLEAQAAYLVYLYREENVHADERRVREYRQTVVDQLLEESREFERIQKEAEEETKRIAGEVSVDRRRRLYAEVLKRRAETDGGAGTA